MKPLTALYPLADALCMDLKFTSRSAFIGTRRTNLSMLGGKLELSAESSIKASLYDSQNGIAYALLHVAGLLHVLVLSEIRKNMLYAYVMDASYNKELTHIGSWSRRRVYAYIAPAVKAIYSRKDFDTLWVRHVRGHEELGINLKLRDAGYSSGGADEMTAKITRGEVTLEEALDNGKKPDPIKHLLSSRAFDQINASRQLLGMEPLKFEDYCADPDAAMQSTRIN